MQRKDSVGFSVRLNKNIRHGVVIKISGFCIFHSAELYLVRVLVDVIVNIDSINVNILGIEIFNRVYKL